jgi:hypothetical protein
MGTEPSSRPVFSPQRILSPLFTVVRGWNSANFAVTEFSEVRLKGVLRNPKLPFGWFVSGPPWN